MATWQWALVVCGLLLPALQLRTFHQLSYLALPSTVAVVLAVAVVLGSLAVNPNVERAPTQVWVPETTPALQIVSHISSFLFAYMGHSMYFEVMREMTVSADFGKVKVRVSVRVRVSADFGKVLTPGTLTPTLTLTL